MMSESSSGSFASEGETKRPPFWVIMSITLSGMLQIVVIPVIPDIRDHFNITDARAGWLVAATSAPGILLAPVIGFLADRYGRRNVVVSCLVIFGLSGALGGLAPNFPALLILRLLQGIGAAGLVNLAVVIIGDYWEGSERSHMIGRNSAVLSASVVLLPPLGGSLASLGGWRLTFMPFLVALAVAFAAYKTLDPHRHPAVPVLEQMRTASSFFKSEQVVTVFLLGSFTFLLDFGLVLTVLPIYMADELGISAVGRGFVFALTAVSGTIAALNLRRLQERFGVPRLLVISFVLWALALGLIAASPLLLSVLIAALVLGVAWGISIPTLQSTAAGIAPTASRGAVVAMFVGFSRAGQTAGPILAAALLAHLGARSTFGIGGAIALVLAIVLVARASSIARTPPAVDIPRLDA